MNFFLFSIFSCIACHKKAPLGKSLCNGCKNNLNYFLNNQVYCSASKYFDEVKSPFLYQSPVSDLIQNFKFHKDLGAGKFLSKFLISFLDKNKIFLDPPELIIPVPLHIKKLRKRGFNQSILIAKWVSQAFNIPMDLKIIQRHQLTPAQVDLSRSERLRNLKNEFKFINKNKFKLSNIRHVALIDDVMTTGATVNEISKILKQAGVEKIEVWCLARAIN